MIDSIVTWFLSSPPAQTITALGALVVALRVQSNREHRATLDTIKGVGDQLNGGLLKRVDRIEQALGIRNESE